MERPQSKKGLHEKERPFSFPILLINLQHGLGGKQALV
ncbi:hypothetical protein TGS27_1595 [Geobacillus stearothermophilus]|uniref:Uncharacterized protein n=1 Tax=Geobacillus stearothermophilus TaxID=1422 RepID=A0A150MSI6_GEOSE|nr:hypothetical protein B4109_1492 [Geobacillus stearothermophilus]OAO81593.1 hypothetical protein TGS27_1595 [Geobacillus stearothermophilus]